MTAETCMVSITRTAKCGKPAAARAVAMCVHEHLLESLLCQSCADEVSAGWASGARLCICMVCREGSERHNCAVKPVLTPIGQEAS